MEYIQQHRSLLIVESILFIILGLFAIIVPPFFTLSFELIVGWLLLFAGAFQTFRSFQSRGTPAFWPTLLGSIAAVLIGLLLIARPWQGILTLTILIAVSFLIEGLWKIAFSTQLRSNSNWGWMLFSGLLGLFLGVYIILGLPQTAVWVIGLLFGINMLFYGISLLSLTLSLPSKPS